MSEKKVQVVVGGQFGDEGKGKIISYLCHKNKYDIVARGGVGPNAGHTIKYNKKEYKVRMTPSGFISKNTRLLIGPGVLVNPVILYKELFELKEYNVEERLGIDYQCGIIEEKHIYAEKEGENKEISAKIGTTKTGCGPAQEDRVRRIGKLAKDIPELKKFLCDVPMELNNAIENGKKILIEGTQGFGLSLYHGTYPYVTSKDTTAS
ncbi:MAG: adenylosuccinate synthetase, partial [Candidatus Altarchaeaceae archaeon]